MDVKGRAGSSALVLRWAQQGQGLASRPAGGCDPLPSRASRQKGAATGSLAGARRGLSQAGPEHPASVGSIERATTLLPGVREIRSVYSGGGRRRKHFTWQTCVI